MNKEISLIYIVAGLSSRFGGKIKQFAKVGPHDTTLIEYSLYQALPAGFSKIIFVVGKMTEQPFKEMFGTVYQGIPVEYAIQSFDESTRDRPRGTVDALCSAKHLIRGPFVVCNGDDIYGANSFKLVVNHLQHSDESVSLGYILENVIPDQGSTNRGIFAVNGDNYVQSIKEYLGIEKNTLSDIGLNAGDLCSMNIFGLTTDALAFLDNVLSQFKLEHIGDRKSECYLPAGVSTIIQEEGVKMKLYPTLDQWFGVTNPEDEEIVKQQIQAYEDAHR